MSRVIIIVAFLLWMSMFPNVTNGQHDVIECIVRDGQNEIHLKLRKTEQLLANQHLPILTARHHRGPRHERAVDHMLLPNFVWNNIGDFILYHDKEKSAAVVFFVRTQTLSGVIDTRYAIIALPLHQCHQGAHLGGGYVESLNCKSMNHEGHLKPLDLSIRGNSRQSLISHVEPPAVKKEWVTTMYLEIMAFIPYDLTKSMKDKYPNNYLAQMVAQHLIYFNAADMLISKLSTTNIEVHLNLAGIVIEEEENVFNFYESYAENIRYLDANKTFFRFLAYALANQFIFPQDSFDFFFISTRHEMWSTDSKVVVEGLSWQPDIYEPRSHRKFDRFWPGAIVEFTCGYEYIAAAHEIAHLMAVEHDAANKGYCYGDSQCHGIMQTINRHCPDCIKWSEESVADFKSYVKHNRDHCFLLNRPRSLFPYGSRIESLSPANQCRCYGFEPRTSHHGTRELNAIPQDGCSQSLVCGPNSIGHLFPLPLDGTRCASIGICWNGICE